MRPFSIVRTVLVASTILIGGFAPVRSHAQQVTISGVVMGGPQSAPLPGVTVRLSASAADLTDVDGRFRFARVDTGAHTLTVQAIGYERRSIALTVRGDTSLRIVLEKTRIILDPVVIRGQAGTLTVKGTIRDAVTGRRPFLAHVTPRPGLGTIGAPNGVLNLKGVPPGERLTLLIEALEYLPVEISFTPGKDTSITVELPPDSVGIRMVAQQVNRLARRAQAQPYSVRAIGSKEIRRWRGTLDELIEQHVPLTLTSPGPQSRSIEQNRPLAVNQIRENLCVVYDDSQIPFYVLKAIIPETVERIEIYGTHARMIRVYSVRYVRSLLRQPELPQIMLVESTFESMCK